MWFSTPSVESLTRPQLAVAAVSAMAAVLAGYCAYTIHSRELHRDLPSLPDATLRRRNAVRRSGTSRRSESVSSSSSAAPRDENVENAPAPTDGNDGVEHNNDDEWWNDPNQLHTQRAGHNIVSLLFRVSEDNARRNGCVHRGCQCNSCGMVPIRGIRYRCANCADFDLCETCESQGVHFKTHIFYKIRIPVPPFGHRQMQPVWYTGDPESCRRSVPRGIMARLSRETGFERPELEAFWEQWTFMANTEWRDDPDQFCIAMDRKTFERCLVPTGASAYAQPNLIHDRMFAFYDSNNDDLIGFSEFLHGLSYRRRKDKLQTVFDGYDIDGDGYVSRQDFLRMFKAYYVLYKQMHRDILDGLEDQLLASTEAQQLVHGRQPLSSLFGREERIPQADSGMRFEGKTYHLDGHVEVEQDKTSAFIENETDTAPRRDILTSLFACEPDRRARRRLVIGHDGDGSWRTARRASGAEADSSYWVTMLDPPNNLEQLSDALLGNRNGTGEENAQRDSADEDDASGGEGQRRGSNASERESRPPTESETRAIAIERSRKEAPKLDKKRRDMARRKIHDRWRRRQFYLDEEEGGQAPDDWSDGEDILAKAEEAERKERRRRERRQNATCASVTTDSDFEDFPFQTRRDTPAYSQGMAEGDAGKEILYQVTQQAFNELLDVIFKPAEDIAVQAAETRLERAAYAALIDSGDLFEVDTDEEGDDGKSQTNGEKPGEEKSSDDKTISDKSLAERSSDDKTVTDESLAERSSDDKTVTDESLAERSSDDKTVTDESLAERSSDDKTVADKSLAELLDESGYTFESAEPRNAVELEEGTSFAEPEPRDTENAIQQEDATIEVAAEYRDPTLPQYRPNNLAEAPAAGPSRQVRHGPKPRQSSKSILKEWKRLNLAEAQAEIRGGWGKLNFEEFEQIYKEQENHGNRLDYLGSWIDFCIP